MCYTARIYISVVTLKWLNLTGTSAKSDTALGKNGHLRRKSVGLCHKKQKNCHSSPKMHIFTQTNLNQSYEN